MTNELFTDTKTFRIILPSLIVKKISGTILRNDLCANYLTQVGNSTLCVLWPTDDDSNLKISLTPKLELLHMKMHVDNWKVIIVTNTR